MRLPTSLLLLLLCAAGCQEPENHAEVGVSWSLPSGTCADVGAEVFRLTVSGDDTRVVEAPCADGHLALRLSIGAVVKLAAELVAGDEPVTEPVATDDPFAVVAGGSEVSIPFALEDFRKSADYRFKASYSSEVSGSLSCADAGVTAQRVDLRHDDDERTPVDGALVCGPDDVCVPADGTDGPCREHGELQTMPDLDWGHYRLTVVGVAPTACYRREDVPIDVDYATRTNAFVIGRTGGPCE